MRLKHKLLAWILIFAVCIPVFQINTFAESKHIEVQEYDPGKGRLKNEISKGFYEKGKGAEPDEVTHDERFLSGYTIQNGIDVSMWNEDIEWSRVKESGIDFAMIRVAYRGYAAQGNLVIDDKGFENIEGALEQNIPIGVYVFSQAITEEEAVEEAEFVLNQIKKYNINLPIVFDFEYASDANGAFTGRLYNANLTKDEATKVCMAFCRHIENAGYVPMVYANKDMLTNNLNASDISDNYLLWLANYTNKSDYEGKYNYWQYTSKGTVDGIKGNVDMNFRYLKEAGEWIEYSPDRYGEILSDTSLKTGSGLEYKKIVDIPKSERILLEGYEKFSDESWYKTTYKGETGYILADHVKLSYQEYVPIKQGKTTANMYMRNGVGLSYDKKLYIPSGSEITLYGYYRVEGYDWYYIGYKGKKGYVSSKYVNRLEAPSKWIGYNPKRYGDLKKDTVLKSGAGTSYKDIMIIPEGERILLDGYKKFTDESWYKTTYKGKAGYIQASNAKLSYQKYAPVKQGKTTANMYMRSGVGLSYSKKLYIPSGSRVTLYGYYRVEGYDWYYVEFNGKKGYISSKYVKRINKDLPVTEIPNVQVKTENLKTEIVWNKIDGADGYKIYRKNGLNGNYRQIGYTTSTFYKDIYKESIETEDEKAYLCAGAFVDPSINPFVYTVRACYNINGKEYDSDYLKDGDFHLETPSIVSVDKVSNTKVSIEWSVLKNAKEYYLYTGYYDKYGDFHWTRVKEVSAKKGVRQKDTINVKKGHNYFTVKAKAIKNGKAVYSGYDKGFTIENRKYNDSNILFIGDSITFGSPYKGINTREVFSYPWRIQQLTGAKIYNPSIPGATYSYKEDDSRDRLITDVALKIKEGKTPKKALHENTQTYKDFDIVVMAAGTNDYSDDVVLGGLDSQNIREFNGSVNQIMEYIKEGSAQRVSEGKDPIKVVFVDLFYSDRTTDYSIKTNRFVTPNEIGLTLTDYQYNLNCLVQKYKDEGVDIYQFSTKKFVSQDNCSVVTSDNLHMSRYTYTQIGNEFSNYLIKNNILK